MKRLVAVILICIGLLGTAGAEGIDLSNMSYDELVALKDQINLAIWSSSEWQEVEVPQGVWIVGEDIPEGKWTIKAPDEMKVYIYWGDKLEESGVELSFYGDVYVSEVIYNEKHRNYEKGDTTEATWELKKGQYVIIEEGIALFMPYSGKQSLGFK